MSRQNDLIPFIIVRLMRQRYKETCIIQRKMAFSFVLFSLICIFALALPICFIESDGALLCVSFKA